MSSGSFGSGTYAHLPRKTQRRVLIVDDDEGIGNLLVESIENHQWDAEAVGSGVEALERPERHAYSLVFWDLMMPRMDGAETLAAIRAPDYDCPVVVITGYPDSELVAKALATATNPILLKPFTTDDIHLAVRHYAKTTIMPQLPGDWSE